MTEKGVSNLKKRGVLPSAIGNIINYGETKNMVNEMFYVTTLVNGGTREVIIYPWLIFRNHKGSNLFLSPGVFSIAS